MAREGLQALMKFGALDYKECIIDNPKPEGVTFTFNKMAKAKPTEVVWFSFITYKSKAHRDEVTKKVMAYLEKKYDQKSAIADMPFKMNRFSTAGFKVVVGA